jgi:hypothetical protein
VHDVDEVTVEPQRDLRAGQFRPTLRRCFASSAVPLASTDRSASMTAPAGSVPARAVTGAAGGGPAGRAPRIFKWWRSSASRLDATVLTSCPSMRMCTVYSSTYTCARCPARSAPMLTRWTDAITASSPLAAITGSNSTAPAVGPDTRPATGPGATEAAGTGCAATSDTGGISVATVSGSGAAFGRNRLAGVAMSNDWWRPLMVVGMHPRTDRRLSGRQVGERPRDLQ